VSGFAGQQGRVTSNGFDPRWEKLQKRSIRIFAQIYQTKVAQTSLRFHFSHRLPSFDFTWRGSRACAFFGLAREVANGEDLVLQTAVNAGLGKPKDAIAGHYTLPILEQRLLGCFQQLAANIIGEFASQHGSKLLPFHDPPSSVRGD
jgi:hypothetical protein